MVVFDEYGARHQFDALCKTVLRHEAISYFRELSRQRERTIQFSALSQYKMGELYTVDEYPSDKFAFSAFGHVLHIIGGRCFCWFAGSRTADFNSALCAGTSRQRSGQFCGLVPQRRPTAQNKDTE